MAKGAETNRLGEQLAKLIEASGHTNWSLGKEAGVNTEVIRRFMIGTRDLTLSTAGRIAAALGVRPLEVAKRRGR